MSVIKISGNAVEEIRKLMERDDLKDYWSLKKSVFHSSIPYFGEVREELRQTAKGPEKFYPLARSFGWAVALVITKEAYVVLNIQPKPGLAVSSLEFPAGGIGKDPKRNQTDILSLTQAQVLKETGYGNGAPTYLGFSLIETGKEFDPAVEEPFVPGIGRGLKAHLIIIEDVELIEEQKLTNTEKIQPVLVSVPDLITLTKENVLVETSAVNCVTLALLNGFLAKYMTVY